MNKTPPRARAIAVGSGGAAYVALSQWLMTRTPPSPWAALVVLGPMLALVAIVAWRRRRGLAGAAGLGLAVLVGAAWRDTAVPMTALYVTQHVAIHAALAAVFALTLRAGREPLVTALARRVHGGRLTPDMVVYTRKVTVAWSVYFVAMGLASIGLSLLAPFAVWATFANFGTPATIALFFVGEHLLRYRLHPEFERASLAAAMRAYTRRDTATIEPRS